MDNWMEDHLLWDPHCMNLSFSISSTRSFPRVATNTHGITVLNSFWKRRCGREGRERVIKQFQNLALLFSTAMSDKVCRYSLNGAAILHYGVKRGWGTDTDGKQGHGSHLCSSVPKGPEALHPSLQHEDPTKC